MCNFLFKLINYSKIELANRHLAERIKRGLTPEDAWNETSIELASISEMHCRAIVIETYLNKMLELVETASEPLKIVLLQLVDLYAVYVALNFRGDLLRVTLTN